MSNNKEIEQLFNAIEGTKVVTEDGVEGYSARQLAPVVGYDKTQSYRFFEDSIEKGKVSCSNSGLDPEEHFTESTIKSKLNGIGHVSDLPDVVLSQVAAYMTMQNCDPNKKEVAIAQQHFAVSTITLENVEDRVVNAVRVQSRQRTRGLEGGFNIAMQNDGITDLGIGLTRSRGHDAYFGAPTSEIKQRYGIPEDRPVTDFVSNTGIMAIGLAAAITTESLESGKVHGLKQVIKEHMGNNTMIREMLATKGIDTTKIVIQPDIKKVERELKREEKNLITNAKKLRISKRSGG